MKLLSVGINVLLVALTLAHKDRNGGYGNGDVDSYRGKNWDNRNDNYNNVGNNHYLASTTCTKSVQPVHTGGYNKPEVRDVHFTGENKHYDNKPIYKPSTTCTKSGQSVEGTHYTHYPTVIKPTTSCTKSAEYAQHTQHTQHNTIIISKPHYEQVKPSHYFESKVLDNHFSKEYPKHTQYTQQHTVIISKPHYEQVKPSHYFESKVSNYHAPKSTSCAESTTKHYVKETSFVSHHKPAYVESKGSVYDTHYSGGSHGKVSYTAPIVSYTAPVASYSAHKPVTHTFVSHKTYYKPSSSNYYEKVIISSSSCTDKVNSYSKQTLIVPSKTFIYTAPTYHENTFKVTYSSIFVAPSYIPETPKGVLPTNSYSVPPAPIKNTWVQPAYPTAHNTYKHEWTPTVPYVPTITHQVLAEHSFRQPPQSYTPSLVIPAPVYTPTVIAAPAPTCITPPVVPVRPVNRKCRVRYEVVMFTDCDDEDISNIPLALPQPTKRAPYSSENNVVNYNNAHGPIDHVKPTPYIVEKYKGSKSEGEVKWHKAKDAHTPYANWHQTPNQGYGSGKSNNWDHVDYIGSHSY